MTTFGRPARPPRTEVLGYYWEEAVCPREGHGQKRGLKSPRGRASVGLVIDISFSDDPSRRGTGAPRPGLQSRYLSAPTGRTKSALIVTQGFNPGPLVIDDNFFEDLVTDLVFFDDFRPARKASQD